jgi:hypothetical protein
MPRMWGTQYMHAYHICMTRKLRTDTTNWDFANNIINIVQVQR